MEKKTAKPKYAMDHDDFFSNLDQPVPPKPKRVGRPKELEGEVFRQSVAIPQNLKTRIDDYSKKHKKYTGGEVTFAALVREGLEAILPGLEERMDKIEKIMKE